MDHDVAGIHQDPIGLRHAFHRHPIPVGLQLLDQMLGHRRHLAVRIAGGDHDVIGHRGFAAQIDGQDVFGLVGVQLARDQGSQVVGGQ